MDNVIQFPKREDDFLRRVLVEAPYILNDLVSDNGTDELDAAIGWVTNLITTGTDKFSVAFTPTHEGRGGWFKYWIGLPEQGQVVSIKVASEPLEEAGWTSWYDEFGEVTVWSDNDDE